MEPSPVVRNDNDIGESAGAGRAHAGGGGAVRLRVRERRAEGHGAHVSTQLAPRVRRVPVRRGLVRMCACACV